MRWKVNGEKLIRRPLLIPLYFWSADWFFMVSFSLDCLTD